MFLKKVIQSFDFADWTDFGRSLFPSGKYGVALGSIGISAMVAFIDNWFGMDASALAVLIFAMFLELTTGIVANVSVKKEPFSSNKLTRFTVKSFVYIFLLFATFQMAASADHRHHAIESDIFEWMRTFFSVQIFTEYVVSILENVSVLSGQEKSYWITKIKDKVKTLI